MKEDAEIIKSSLDKYPLIKKYFGKIIEQRLAINDYEYGMLTAQLLDEHSKLDLERLEDALELGEKNQCTNFEAIFHERALPEDKSIDGEIINLLAEVRAFEFLHWQGFRDIAKIKRKQGARTVDFTAKRNNDNYAAEVVRLGLAQADRKKPKHMVEDNLIRHTISGEDKLVGEVVGNWFISSGEQNIPRIIETIRDTITNKYPQIKNFCQTQGGDWKGMLIISTGCDYFVMNKYAKTEFEVTPKAVEEAVRKLWNLLDKDQVDRKYLYHLVIATGKDLDKTIIHPSLFKEHSS